MNRKLLDRSANTDLEDLLGLCSRLGSFHISIISRDGKVLSRSGEIHSCRSEPAIYRDGYATCDLGSCCIDDPLSMADDVSIFRCRNGACFARAPLSLNGNGNADLYIGHFLLSRSTRTFYGNEAERLGYPPDKYSAMMLSIPVYDKDGIGDILQGISRTLASRKDQATPGPVKTDSDLLEMDQYALLETMFDAIPDIIGIQDINHRVIRYNRAGYRMLGKTREEILGKKCYELVGRDSQCDNCATGIVYRTRKPAHVERYEESLKKWFEINAYPVIDGDGRMIRVIEHLRDITDKKKTLEALRRSEEKFRTIFENSPIGIFHYDHSGRITIANRSMASHFGISRSEISGFMLSRGIKERELIEAIDRSLSGKDGYYKGVYRSPLTAATAYVRTHFKPLFDESGKPAGGICIWEDLTHQVEAEEERKNLEEQVLHSQKLESLGVLAGGIAHDFNNLLVAILGNVDLALADIPKDSPARSDLMAAATATKRAAELCDQMLAYSGKGVFVKKPLELATTVKNLSNILKASISKKIFLEYRFAKNTPLIEADPSQIRQMLMNLIINAAESIGEDSGIITISTGLEYCDQDCLENAYFHEDVPPGYYLLIEVLDTGCGINDKLKSKIFEPFMTTKFTGRGLGLSTVLGIVRGHKGLIQLKSAPGRGSSFRIYLPALRDAADSNADTSSVEEEEWSATGTVLLIDDEGMVRKTGKRMLEKIGFDVITASDGREGIDLFKKNREIIDCVLLDLTMPQLDGIQTYQELVRIDPGIKVIMSSGYSESSISGRLPAAKIGGFIKKPYSFAELKTTMKRLFNH